MSLTPIGDLGIALKADIDDYEKAMASASDITAGLGGTVRSLSRSVRNMGAVFTAASAAAGAGMFVLSRRAQEVNSAFREVDTLVQDASDSQEKYGDLVSELNTEYGLQADRLEVIEGLYQSISAGVDQSTESQRAFLSTASKLAVVGRVELGTAVDVLSTIMNTYNMEASDAEQISESLFQTVQFGKTRLEELAPVLGRVAALGSNLGVQMDEIGASMAILTRTGFESRVAATGLRNIFRSMLKPSDRMKDALFDIASQQDFFASQFESSSKEIRGIASNFRDAADAVDKYTKKQQEARAVQENSSTAIQEARLKIEAIQEDRLNQLPKLTNETVRQADSVSELESIIDDYQFKVNKARVQEKKFREEKEEAQSQVKEYKNEISDIIATSGDFGNNIGQLILENQHFIDTLVGLKERVNETDTSMSDLFPRTRALQGALALVGEEGEALRDVFDQMQNDNFDARQSYDNLNQSVKDNFNSFEEFKKATQDVQAGDLDKWFEEVQGPQQQFRNAMSTLKESATDLGQVFTEDVTDSISSFAESIDNAVEYVRNLEESVRENISEMAMLGVGIGLILGPLMFFGGQLAIIASVIGASFIPIILGAAAALGVLGHGLVASLEDGEESEEIIGSLQSTLANLTGSVKSLYSIFIEEVAPGIRKFGEGVADVFYEVSDSISSFSSEGEDGIEAFGSAVGFIFEWLGKILSDNSEDIGQFVENVLGTISDIISNSASPAIREELIPALNDLFDSLGGVVSEFITLSNNLPVERIISFLEDGAKELVLILSSIIGQVSSFISENKELIARLLMITPLIWGIVKGGMTLIPILSKLSGLFAVLKTVAAPLIGIVKELLIVLATGLINGSGVVGSLKLLVSYLASLMGPVGWAIAAIATAIALLSAAWVTDFAGMRDTLQPLVDLLGYFWDRITSEVLPVVMDLLNSVWDLGLALFGLVEVVIKLVVAFFNLGSTSYLAKAILVAVQATIDGIITFFIGLIEIITGVIDIFTALVLFLQGDFTGAWKKVKSGIANIFLGILDIIIGIIQFLSGLLAATVGVIIGLVADIIKGILSLGVKLVKALGSIMQDFKEWLIQLFVKLISNLITALAFGNLKQKFIDFFTDILMAAWEFGKNIPRMIKDGIMGGLPSVDDAMDTLMSHIRQRFPGQNSSGNDAKEAGEKISEDTAKGIEENKDEPQKEINSMFGDFESNSDASYDTTSTSQRGLSESLDTEGMGKDIGSSAKEEFTSDFSIEEDNMDVESDVMDTETTSPLSERQTQEKGVKKVIIDEKAVYFEKGAFQGVSDEEIPEMVEEEVDNSLNDIVDEMDGAGKSYTR